MKAIVCIATMALAFASVSANELRGGPVVLSDVTTNDVGREIHGKSRGESLKWYTMTKLIADIDPCDTFAVKFSDCLQSEGESIIEVVACFDCLSHAWVSKLEDGYTCADLKIIGYCDAIEDCAVGACNNQCSSELNDVEECLITNDGCNNREFYRDECIFGI